jgi:hypothetical protein
VFSEGREILAVLDRSGKLPSGSRVYLTDLTGDLAGSITSWRVGRPRRSDRRCHSDRAPILKMQSVLR